MYSNIERSKIEHTNIKIKSSKRVYVDRFKAIECKIAHKSKGFAVNIKEIDTISHQRIAASKIVFLLLGQRLGVKLDVILHKGGYEIVRMIVKWLHSQLDRQSVLFKGVVKFVDL